MFGVDCERSQLYSVARSNLLKKITHRYDGVVQSCNYLVGDDQTTQIMINLV